MAVLSRRAEFETNPAHASVLEVEAAQIEAENLGRAEAALESLGRALAFDTTNLGAVDYYVRMLQRLGRGDELEASLGTLAEKLSDPVAKAAIYRRQAEVFEAITVIGRSPCDSTRPLPPLRASIRRHSKRPSSGKI